MPGGDRTGPLGLGPMTGRRAGYCAGYPVPGFINPFVGYRGYGLGFGHGFGRGMGRGMHRGRGYGYMPYMPYMPYGSTAFGYNPAITAEEELNMLKEHARLLQGQLEEIQKQVKVLEEELKQDKK